MGQADLISIMVLLGVLVQHQKIKEKKIGRYCSCFYYKTRFIRSNSLGDTMKGLSN